jgi:hypothetical protein
MANRNPISSDDSRVIAPFTYQAGCPVNQKAAVIPADGKCHYARVAIGPTSIKHLYNTSADGKASYDQRFAIRAVGTMYDSDFTQTHSTGVGRGKVLGGGHFKTTPMTDRLIRDDGDFTDYTLPRPQPWTVKYGQVSTVSSHHL